ncbi:MAG: Crp/Fnr family transcriptional regulator [Myxococcota bacterium]
MNSNQPFQALEKDISDHGVELPPTDRLALREKLSEVRARSGSCIYGQQDIGDRWLFLTEGIAASRQNHADGSSSIARFFEKGQFCGNLTSTWTRDYAADDLVALTEVVGVEVPAQVFRQEYLGGAAFGEYLRLVVMETLCFDKEIIVVKTACTTETRYRFLEERYEAVIGSVRHKDVAAFLGVTPQGLSRFLRKRRQT